MAAAGTPCRCSAATRCAMRPCPCSAVPTPSRSVPFRSAATTATVRTLLPAGHGRHKTRTMAELDRGVGGVAPPALGIGGHTGPGAAEEVRVVDALGPHADLATQQPLCPREKIARAAVPVQQVVRVALRPRKVLEADTGRGVSQTRPWAPYAKTPSHPIKVEARRLDAREAPLQRVAQLALRGHKKR